MKIMHPVLKTYVDNFESIIPTIKNINEWSLERYRLFTRWDMTQDDEGQREAYRKVFDRLGQIGRFNYDILNRIDDRTVGEFGLYLIDNIEVDIWKHVWPYVLPKLEALYPGIPLDWEYNGLSEEPYIIFFRKGDLAANLDIRIVHKKTRQRVAVVEVKDGALFGYKATYKHQDVASYAKLDDDVFVVTAYRQGNKSGPFMAFSWMDKRDLVSMVDASYLVVSCPWMGRKDAYCFREKTGEHTDKGRKHMARAFHPLFDWNTGVKV